MEVLPEKSFVLPASLKTIEAEALYGVAAEWIAAPEGCVSIGDRAFSSLRSLYYVSLPGSVTSISESAFLGCIDVVFICPPGSAAAAFAQRHGFNWFAG